MGCYSPLKMIIIVTCCTRTARSLPSYGPQMAFVSDKRRNYGLSTSEKLKGEDSDGNEVRFTVVGDKATATGHHRRSNRKAGDGERGGRVERDGRARYRQGYLQHSPRGRKGGKDTIFVTGLRQLGAQWSRTGTDGKDSEQRDHEHALEQTRLVAEWYHR